MRRKTALVVGTLFLLTFAIWAVQADENAGAPFFEKSLHFTGEGMRYWYEAEDGFMQITGIPYDELSCKNCHAQTRNSCDVCHVKKDSQQLAYSVANARKKETCLQCHAREGATIKMDQQRGTLGVHMAAGMECMDCHTAREVHGDGVAYKTMRDPKSRDVACTNCHQKDSDDYQAIPDTTSHKIHNNKLACNACHVENSMSCFNCHFGEFAKTKNKKISFTGKVKDWLLLINYNGQVTSATIQSLVGKNNEPFIMYAPYFTHSIMKQGRKCEQCHNAEAVNTLVEGRKFKMAQIENGKIDFFNGVVPVVPELLDWPFLEKVDGKWQPFEPTIEPLIQMGLFGTSISESQLKKLKRKYTYKE